MQDAPSDTEEPLSGAVLSDKWRLGEVLGRGGMGRVYEARHVDIPKRAAVKIIDGVADAETLARFRREAEAASLVESPHVVHVFDSGTMPDGRPYLVMERLEGESLGARLRRSGALPVDDTLRVVDQVLRGLEKAHAAGVVHRDLKPDNVFLEAREGGEIAVKLLDFGISKRLLTSAGPGPTTLTQRGAVIGTPHYMSPEQAHGEPDIDGRSDLFSLGTIFYECLTGRPPHADLPSYEAVVVALCTREPPSVRAVRAEIPDGVAKVLDRALAKDRAARFQTAREMRGALARVVPDVVRAPESLPRDTAAPAIGDPSPTKSIWTGGARAPRPRGRGAVIAAVGAGLLVAAGALAWRRAPRSHTAPASPLALGSRPGATDRAGGTVRLHVRAVPAEARLVIDGEERPDGVIEGPPLSAHTVEVSLPGHPTDTRTVILDGKTELLIELGAASPAPSAASSPAPTRRPGPAPAAVSTPAPKPTASTGLKLKVDP